jgi:hypothetical protein
MTRKLTVAATAVIVAVAGLTVAKAADYFSPYFQAKQEQVLAPAPCGDHGGLMGPASLGHDDGSLLLAFTCNDQRVILWRDMRPGSGNSSAVGARTSSIKVQLDAPNGTVQRGGVVAGGGWAFECGHVIEGFQISVGGMVVYDVTRGTRPDVIAAYGSCAANAGFNFTIDTSRLSAGTYPVSVLAADDQGFTNVSNQLTLTVLP